MSITTTVVERPAFRTEGFLTTITRDEAREVEQRPDVKKQLFRCASQPNEPEHFTTSPIKPVLKPTLHDHREWEGAEIENMRAIACMAKEKVSWFANTDVKALLKENVDEQLDLKRRLKENDDEQLDLKRRLKENGDEHLDLKKRFDEQEKEIRKMQQSLEELNKLQAWLGKRGATLDCLVNAYEDKQITWTVECGNRVLELLDREVHKLTFNMEGADAKTSYMTLLRSLERNVNLEHESLVAAAEQAAVHLLHHVLDFPKDARSLRMQMLEFLQVREYRHSVTHMHFKEGGEKMMENVCTVEDWIKQKLIPMVSGFSGVVAGGISLMRMRAKQESQEETKSKPVQNKPTGSLKEKGKTEVVVRSSCGSRLFVLRKDDPTKTKVPLFLNAKGQWTAKLPNHQDVVEYSLIAVQGETTHTGPDFTVVPQQKNCFVEWEAETTSGEPASKATSGEPASKATEGEPASKATEGEPASKATEGEPASKATEGEPATEGEIPWLGRAVTVSLVSLVLISWWSKMKQVTA